VVVDALADALGAVELVHVAIAAVVLHHWPVVAYAVYDEARRRGEAHPYRLALWYGFPGPIGIVRYWRPADDEPRGDESRPGGGA
jgi:hypothetical protein